MAAITVVAEERENEAAQKDGGDDETKEIQKAVFVKSRDHIFSRLTCSITWRFDSPS